MRTRLLALCAFALFACAAQVTAEEPADLAERREATLRYGIEGQVIELLDALRSEKNSDFDQLIAELLESSTSPKLVVALLDYFSKSGSSAAEGRAAALIAGRDEQDDGVVGAAFSYLTAVKSGAALDDALTILKDGEKRYEQAAVKMLGAAGRAEHAAALRQKYDAYDSTPAIRQDILLALGGLASPDSFDLLAKVASDTGAGKVERMYACSSLGKLGDAQAVPILVKASTADDPNVRAYAVEALGGFPGGDVSSAILSSLRDAHVLPRTAAVKAAGALGLSDAVPALEYKASYDPERQVREAAIDALARIGGGRAFSFIAGMLEDAKAASMYRAKALAVIVTSGDASSRKRAMDVFDKAALDKDRNLFQALARAVLVLDGTEAAAYAERLLADSDYTSRLAALAWVERNKYKGLAGVVKNLSETDPVPAVKKRAAETLGRLN